MSIHIKSDHHIFAKWRKRFADARFCISSTSRSLVP
jgi:hypothetical protein